MPHRMTRGGLSSSRTLSSSVRPSVSSACRVSSGRLRGSADQASPLISITTWATSAPREISQRQPRASPPAREFLPRFALICQPISPRLRHTRDRRDDHLPGCCGSRGTAASLRVHAEPTWLCRPALTRLAAPAAGHLSRRANDKRSGHPSRLRLPSRAHPGDQFLASVLHQRRALPRAPSPRV